MCLSSKALTSPLYRWLRWHLRTQSKAEEYISAEAVLAHYHGNAAKAKQAIIEAELDGSGLDSMFSGILLYR